MKSIGIIISKEWQNFVKSDGSAFAIYIILIAVWSMLFAVRAQAVSDNSSFLAGPMMLVFFSVLISANYSNTVFISERTSGALEILLTSGLSRDALLFGKMIFIIIMTLAIGILCAALSLLLIHWIPAMGGGVSLFTVTNFLLYLAATFTNASSSAYFSVRLSSPRILHFVNLLLFMAVMGGFMAIENAFPSVTPALCIAVLTLTGIVFALLARHEFRSERIAQPVLF